MPDPHMTWTFDPIQDEADRDDANLEAFAAQLIDELDAPTLHLLSGGAS